MEFALAHVLRLGFRPGMVRLWIIGALLCCLMVLLSIGSHYQYSDFLFHPAIWTTAILMIAGLVWLTLSRAVQHLENTRTILALILVVGLVMRLILLSSIPILEIDYFRYLWDGVVVVNGLNPYAISPEAALLGTNIPDSWKILAENHRDLIDHINYAPLRTIYPPVAQVFFWLAVSVPGNFDLLVLRLILIACECVTVIFLLLMLKDAGQPAFWVVLYWWNPLIIKEFVNSAHMDAILLPFLVGAVWLASRSRVFLSTLSLACAIGVKVWPVLLVPLLVKRQPFNRLLITVPLLFSLLLLMAWPIITTRLDSASGFIAYAADWSRNDAAFSLLERGMAIILDNGGLERLDPGRLARLAIALIVGLIAFFVMFRSQQKLSDLVFSITLITATLFLLSATGYPWYYAWILPFLVITRQPSLMLLTVLLPLYYLRFYFVEAGQVEVFDDFVVWIEFGPVLVLFFWELISRNRLKKYPI